MTVMCSDCFQPFVKELGCPCKGGAGQVQENIIHIPVKPSPNYTLKLSFFGYYTKSGGINAAVAHLAERILGKNKAMRAIRISGSFEVIK